jgi:hypothetical protein
VLTLLGQRVGWVGRGVSLRPHHLTPKAHLEAPPAALARLQCVNSVGAGAGKHSYNPIKTHSRWASRRANTTDSDPNGSCTWTTGNLNVRVRGGIAAPDEPANHYLRSVYPGVVEDRAACTPPHPSASLPLSSAAQHNAPTGQAALPPPVLARSTREPDAQFNKIVQVAKLHRERAHQSVAVQAPALVTPTAAVLSATHPHAHRSHPPASLYRYTNTLLPSPPCSPTHRVGS